jgi:integrase
MTNAKNKNYLDDFISSLKTQSTKNLYRINLNLFFKVIKGNPKTYFIDDEYGEPTTNPDIPYKRDAITFYKFVEKSNTATKTKRLRIATLKSFFDWGETELSKKFWKKHTFDNYVETESAITSKEDWRTIITNSNYPLKTILLIGLSSGCRISEILQLKENNYYKDENPPRLFIKGEITKKKHIRNTFLTPEATKSLEIWLKQKDKRIKLASKKHFGKKLKDYDKNKIFPYDYNTIKKSFNIVCDAVGFGEKDEQTNRRKYHIHLARGYAKSRMRLVMNEKYMNLVIGHKEYMPSYEQYVIEAIGEDYKKVIPSLMIFTEPTEKVVLDRLKKDLEEKAGEIGELKNQLKETEMNMEKRFNERLRVQGEYNQIINDVRRGKIKLPEYEKELIEDWGSIVTTATDEDWDDYDEDGFGEPFETYTILEKIREKRRKK